MVYDSGMPKRSTAPDPPPPANGKARRILHVDCDMFFVQVAKLEDPERLGSADLVLVGGRPEGRGVVTSASYGARAFGVRSGMPMGQAVRLCPDAIVVGVPRGACARRSREVRAVLQRFSPVVEAASIDEFYLDLTGTERLYHHEPLATIAGRIRAAVLAETEISVSIGGSARRVVAKMATRLAKPGGVYVVPVGEEQSFMQRFELRDIPGVGPVLAETLQRRGLVAVPDALGYDLDALRAWLGDRRGRWLHDRVRGIDDTAVAERDEARSVSHERTFATDVHELQELERQLVRAVDDLAIDLRAKGLRARTIRVYLKDRDFKVRQLGRTPGTPMETAPAIHRIALPLLRELWSRRSVGVRLLGVGASGLVPRDEPEQMRLLEAEAPLETDRERTVARAADRVRARFGRGSIGPGGALRDDK
jgi:DNA polymerase-4